MGGIAATSDYVIFGDRDAENFHDIWRCLDAKSGDEKWRHAALALGALDYGNSPRTTPLLHAGHAFLLGAFGDLLCVEITSGQLIWQVNLRTDFAATAELPWGYCGSPLIADGKLIVNPGADDASIVALDLATGKVIWKAAGQPAGYGSLLHAKLGGKSQVIGHSAKSLNGWDASDGRLIWTLTPDIPGDFNVPTPILLQDGLLVTTENNGTRLYGFDNDGVIKKEPLLTNRQLRPDMSTPVVVGDRLFCADKFLFCLDWKNDLKELSRVRDKAIGDYAAMIASPNRILLLGKGQLLVLDPSKDGEITSRWTLFPEQTELYSHAAYVDGILYVRGETALKRLSL